MHLHNPPNSAAPRGPSRLGALQSGALRSGAGIVAALGALALLATASHAQGGAAADPMTQMNTDIGDLKMAADTVWVIVAAVLVFFMQAGFAYVEGGMTRAKNQNNILMKNLLDFCFGTISFFVVGFAFMFSDGGALNSFIGLKGFFMMGDDTAVNAAGEYAGAYPGISWASVPLDAKFLFQLVFAATAATIVSGAMAERTKFSSYLLYSIVISAIIYPISGHWIWGGGWLSGLGFFDFAGSTVVHSVGAWIALVGAAMLGPRIGKYNRDGSSNVIPGHSIPMAGLGVFILWLGWFGFNPGSTMSAVGGYKLLAHIAVTTNAAAAAGGVMAMITVWLTAKKPDVGMTLNGVLGGLVAITAPCAWVTTPGALAIGALAGVLVVLAANAIEKTKTDDPVSAVAVHGVCGAFGTLCVGLFASPLWAAGTDANPKVGLLYGGGFEQLAKQAAGVGAVFAWCIVTGLILFTIIKAVNGLRVSAEEEVEGLDIHEHGGLAYPNFATADVLATADVNGNGALGARRGLGFHTVNSTAVISTTAARSVPARATPSLFVKGRRCRLRRDFSGV